MITELVLKNFKSVKKEVYRFSDFDLLVGRNNSGKSTILQSLAIWQYCVDEFHRMKRKGQSGAQIVLPNFTALPLPEFNLLWTDKVDREYPQIDGAKKQQYIYIEIIVKWSNQGQEEKEFGIKLRYHTPQSIYAIPSDGWNAFKQIDESGGLPKIVYVPPFSGLDPFEKWLDDAVVRQQVGKGQPGSVLRNLLFRVIDKPNTKPTSIEGWNQIVTRINDWFGVEMLPPEYEKGISINIESKYKNEKGREFDIISGGSGFHQTLTLLGFYYGYPELTTILFDEPDAHMHVNLQREILSYFRQFKTTQFIIATHAEEFIRGVSPESIISVLNRKPQRIASTPEVITALSDVDNMAVIRTQQDPYILYVEGEDDERILNAWAAVLEKEHLLSKFYVEKLGGSTKNEMKKNADQHFKGLQKIVPGVKRVILFDYDQEDSYHPDPHNEVLVEWGRKNIENYLLVPDVWKRALLDKKNQKSPSLFDGPANEIVDNFFQSENLNLPQGKNWRNLDANIFKVIDGKKILFEQINSLFQQINIVTSLKINREVVCRNFQADELHDDIHQFFAKLTALVN
jgi:predicted ATPase